MGLHHLGIRSRVPERPDARLNGRIPLGLISPGHLVEVDLQAIDSAVQQGGHDPRAPRVSA